VTGPEPTIEGMVDDLGRPATIFTPPEVLRRDPNRWPTPAEFVSEWGRYTDEQRLALAERILDDAQAVGRVRHLADELAGEFPAAARLIRHALQKPTTLLAEGSTVQLYTRPSEGGEWQHLGAGRVERRSAPGEIPTFAIAPEGHAPGCHGRWHEGPC
jgi:hypothetical protein